MEKKIPYQLQDEVWSVLKKSIESGKMTEAEAAARYEKWRAGYLGKLAIESSEE